MPCPRTPSSRGAAARRQLDPEQAWFWTPEWKVGEREADAQIAAGAGDVLRSTEEFIAHLERVPAPGE